jgi:hypothetical protein
MVTQKRRLLSVAVTALASTILIGNAAAVMLNIPVANAVIPQNDPTTRCPHNPSYGSGFQLRFKWYPTTAPNFDHYHLVVQHSASTPIFDGDLGRWQHRLGLFSCGFVIDSNLSGWHWQVTTFDAAGHLLETSELRFFGFGPCRVNGQVCFSGP